MVITMLYIFYLLAPVSAPRNLQLNLGQAYLAEVIWDEVQDSNGFTKGYYVRKRHKRLTVTSRALQFAS